jgi:hypothetical protein
MFRAAFPQRITNNALFARAGQAAFNQHLSRLDTTQLPRASIRHGL